MKTHDSEHRVLRSIAVLILLFIAMDTYFLMILNHDWRIMIWSFLCVFLIIQYGSKAH